MICHPSRTEIYQNRGLVQCEKKLKERNSSNGVSRNRSLTVREIGEASMLSTRMIEFIETAGTSSGRPYALFGEDDEQPVPAQF